MGSEPGTPATQEPREIRHLREYSRFLAPRSSLIHVDLWEGALAAIGGAVPTLLTTTAIVACMSPAWTSSSSASSPAFTPASTATPSRLVTTPGHSCPGARILAPATGSPVPMRATYTVRASFQA